MIILIGIATTFALVLHFLGWPKQLADVAASSIMLVGGVGALSVILHRIHSREGNTYDLLDLLLDGRTRKASLEAHITVFMAMLAAWWIVSPTATLAKGEIIVQILGIFILYRGAKQGVDAWRDKPTMPPGDTNIAQQVNVPAVPPPVEPTPPAAPVIAAETKPKLQPVILPR